MSETDTRIRTVLIAGGGVDGWMAACVLARALPGPHYSIRLIDLPDVDEGPGATLGGQASLPSIRGLLGQIGLSESDLFRRTNATVSLGGDHHDWSRIGARWFQPFGDFGAALDGTAFHNYWLRLRASGDETPFEDYALAAVAARKGRFAPPSDDPGSVLSTFTYGYHWNAAALRDMLADHAIQMGVERIRGDIGAVRFGEREGFIEAVTLTDGRELQADLHIDASGPRAVLATPDNRFEDWSRWLPCDRVTAAQGDEDGLDAPFTETRAHDAGWSWRMALGRGVGRGVVWSSAHMDDDAAQKLLGQSGKTTHFRSGRRDRTWVGNCVAIGGAACVIDPVAPTSLHLTQTGLWTLLTLMPDRRFEAVEAKEYNRLMAATMERARDFAVLRYCATKRTDSPFWRDRATVETPEFLAHRMRLFQSRGRLILRGEDTFNEADWSALFLGQGLHPRMHDPLADTPPEDWVRERLSAMRRAIQATAEAMPPARDFIARMRGPA